MIRLEGNCCKDCKVFTDNIEDEALKLIYSLLSSPMFKGAKIRIMPDVHMGKISVKKKIFIYAKKYSKISKLFKSM